MSRFAPLFAVLVLGLSLYQLWMAFSRGEVRGRAATYHQASEPIRFWLSVILNAAMALTFGLLGLIWARQAVTHGIDWSASDLIRRDLASNYSDYYPQRAQRQKVEGSAVLSCRLTAARKLRDCSVLTESPPGYGFGEAGLRMASLMTMHEGDGLGGKLKPGQTIRLPVRFKLPQEPVLH